MAPRQVPVSVIIPHHNRARRLGRALASVLWQSVRPAEILIVDDASRPDERKRLKAYHEYARIIELPQNAGPARARNAGIAEARCPLLAFLDDDDEWLPDKIEMQYEFLRAEAGYDAVTSAIEVVDARARQQWVMRHHTGSEVTLKAALEATPAMIQTLMIRSGAMARAGGFDPAFRQLEDQEFFIRLAGAGLRVRHMQRPLARLNRGGDDHLTSEWLNYLKHQLAVIEKHRKLYERVFGQGAARKAKSVCLRRAGVARSGVAGRAVYLWGCVEGRDLSALSRFLCSGRLADIPYPSHETT